MKIQTRRKRETRSENMRPNVESIGEAEMEAYKKTGYMVVAVTINP